MARKYFGTDGVRGKVGEGLINPEFAMRLGYAAGCVLASEAGNNRSRPAVLIGKDTRISGYMLESALEAGFAAAGVDVYLAGPLPTPAIAYLTRTLRLNAGVVISASHNPFPDNGIKFFSAQGTKLPDDIEEAIEAQIDQPMRCVDSLRIGRAFRVGDAPGRYIEFCKSTFPNDLNLRGIKLVVDAANGAAYHIAPHVFSELGAAVIPVGCQPDGMNINEGVGALHPQNLAKAVQEHGADYGIALDGDADRLQMVDAQGNIYNGDQLLYAIVHQPLKDGEVEGVAGTLMTNLGLENALREFGVAFGRAKVGDRYVLEMMQQKHWRYGGESSGHLLCLEHHSTGDGIIAALQVFSSMLRSEMSLAQLTSKLKMYPQLLVNVPLDPQVDWKDHEELNRVKSEIEQELGQRGRVLIRASGTEPILRLMVEAETEDMAAKAMDRLKSVKL